jgi:hypothetical protein
MAHDIYPGLHDKTGQLCCGGDDCARTHFKTWTTTLENGNVIHHYSFLTRADDNHIPHWIEIPEERITFLPIPGDAGPAADDLDYSHYGHLCYRYKTERDELNFNAKANLFDDIWVYCAFIPPGAI